MAVGHTPEVAVGLAGPVAEGAGLVVEGVAPVVEAAAPVVEGVAPGGRVGQAEDSGVAGPAAP